jgi:WD40 repeat protein
MRYTFLVAALGLWSQTASVYAANQPELVLQTGHLRAVNTVAFSPNGKWLATGSYDKTVILWETSTGQQLRTLQGHTGDVRSVAFSPDGKWLASGSEDKTAVLWEVASGQKLRTLRCEEWINSVSFSPDGKWLATGLNDGTAALWDASSGQKVRTFPGQGGTTNSVAFSPDGKWLATGFYDHTAELWEVSSGRKIRTFQGHSDRVLSVAFSPDGKWLATGSRDYTTILWDASSGQQIRRLQGHSNFVNSVAFSPDGKVLATGSRDNTAVLWDASNGQKLRTLEGHYAEVSSVAFSLDGKWLASGDGKGETLWEASTGQKLRTFQGHTSAVNCVAFSPDGKALATGSEDQTAALWEAASGQQRRTLQGHSNVVNSLAFSPDGKWLATGSWDKTAVLWEVSSGLKLRSLPSDETIVESVAFSPDGKWLATTSGDTAILWEPSSGQKLRTLQEAINVTSVAFSPDGKWLATGDGFLTAVLWEASTGRKLHSLGHRGGVASVAFSPDGKWLATGVSSLYPDEDSAVIWDAASGQKVRTLAHKGHVTSVAFSPDGKWLATGAEDRTVVLWEASTGQKLRTLQGHADHVKSMAFSPEGKWLLTGSSDGSAILWDAKTGKESLRLLSLDAGQDWVVVTPDGLFDGSAGGRNKVSYRVGGGLTVVPVDRFFKDFYHPGLLAAILRGERPKPEVDFGAQTPPKVRIVSPTPGGDTQTNPITVLIEAEDQGGGVKTPWLRHNGVRVGATEPPQRQGKIVRQKYLISLVEGGNILEAVSACADGSWESEPARIELRFTQPVEKPRLFLLSAGVNRYADEPLKLRFAASDAQAMHDLFLRRGRQLYAGVVPVLLSDEKATRNGIRAAFRQIAEQAKPQDTVLVFLAGHGTLVGQRYYYLPADFRTDKDKPREQAVRDLGIPDDELADLIGAVPALKRVLILDTCNAGGATALFNLRGRDVDGLRGVTERMNRAQGAFVLAAAPANAEAKEPEELGHGVLTYSLLAGLHATAAGPLKDEGVEASGREPVADVLGLFTFASGNVPRLMKKYFGREQDVQMSTAGTSFPILPLRD